MVFIATRILNMITFNHIFNTCGLTKTCPERITPNVLRVSSDLLLKLITIWLIKEKKRLWKHQGNCMFTMLILQSLEYASKTVIQTPLKRCTSLWLIVRIFKIRQQFIRNDMNMAEISIWMIHSLTHGCKECVFHVAVQMGELQQ